MPYVELSQSRAKNSRSSFCYTVITINLTKLYLKYLYIHPQTLTEDNLTLRLLDPGSQQDKNKAKRYNKHLGDNLVKTSKNDLKK